jgi:hypothetical protein
MFNRGPDQTSFKEKLLLMILHDPIRVAEADAGFRIFLHILDTSSDILYIATVPFISPIVFYALLISVIFPPLLCIGETVRFLSKNKDRIFTAERQNCLNWIRAFAFHYMLVFTASDGLYYFRHDLNG